jgi:hypothetical protein
VIGRPDREDLTAQRERLAAARTDLHTALEKVQREALTAARLVASRAKLPPMPDLTNYLAAHQAVLRAEEAHDLARLDLDTAGGADA